jgi:hypothetical protein
MAILGSSSMTSNCSATLGRVASAAIGLALLVITRTKRSELAIVYHKPESAVNMTHETLIL